MSFKTKKYLFVKNAVSLEMANLLYGYFSFKKRVFKKYLDTGKYARVRVFDDSIANLKALLSLENDYPDIKFDAWLVQASGNIRSVK